MGRTSAKQLAKELNISPARSLEAVMKAQLIKAISAAIEEHGFTHAIVAKRSGIPRSAVTGILTGSLQKVSLDRLLRLLEAVRLTAEVRIKNAA